MNSPNYLQAFQSLQATSHLRSQIYESETRLWHLSYRILHQKHTMAQLNAQTVKIWDVGKLMTETDWITDAAIEEQQFRWFVAVNQATFKSNTFRSRNVEAQHGDLDEEIDAMYRDLKRMEREVVLEEGEIS